MGKRKTFKPCNKSACLIKNTDLFSPQISSMIKFKGKASHQTLPGGILSILLILSIGVYGY